jgi:hypothetical protein
MSLENQEWNDVAKEYKKVFGKNPRKNTKIETMVSRLAKEQAKNNSSTEGEEEEAPENPAITEKMAELMAVAKEVPPDETPTMICLVLGEKGIHMSMSGEGQEVAIMVATAICSEPRVGAVLTNGAMMAQMRMNNVANKANLDAEGNEIAPEGMPKEQTEA